MNTRHDREVGEDILAGIGDGAHPLFSHLIHERLYGIRDVLGKELLAFESGDECLLALTICSRRTGRCRG